MGVNLEKIKTAVQKAEAAILFKDYALGLLLRMFPIYVDVSAQTAYTDGWGIYLPPDFASKRPEEQVYILLHELSHIVAKHTSRRERFLAAKGLPQTPELALLGNLAADYVIDTTILPPFLTQERKAFIQLMSTLFKLPKNASFEEVFEALLKQMRQPGRAQAQNPSKPSNSQCLGGGKGGEREGEEEEGRREGGGEGREEKSKKGEEKGKELPEELKKSTGDLREKGKKDYTVQGGEGEEPSTPEEKEREIERRLVRAVQACKMAGKDPGFLARLVDELLKPVIPWQRLLRFYVERGLGRAIRRTWFRPSRKSPLRPGKQTLKLKRVTVLVDTSGSIDDETLRRFVTEVYGIAKERAEVVVIPWDATVYEPIVVKRLSDINKVKNNMKGGGGTMIWPALQTAEKINSDIVVILSDWVIGDKDTENVREWLYKNRNRVIAATVEADPPEFLKTVRVPRFL